MSAGGGDCLVLSARKDAAERPISVIKPEIIQREAGAVALCDLDLSGLSLTRPSRLFEDQAENRSDSGCKMGRLAINSLEG